MKKAGNIKPEEQVDLTLSDDINENLAKLKAFLEESSDIVFREFKLGLNEIHCALTYVDGLIDKEVVNNHILKSFMYQVTILEGNRGKPIDNSEAFNGVKNT